MNNSRRLLFIFLEAVIILCTTAYAGYQISGRAESHEPVSPTQESVANLDVVAKPVSGQFHAVPAIELADLRGEKRNLQEWQGKVVVLNFWASWCQPCQERVKELVKLQRQYGDQGVQVIGLGLDSRRSLKQAERSLGVNYPVLVSAPGANSALLAEWGNADNVVPYTVIIDRNGNLSHIQRGALNSAAFNQQLRSLL